jgi:methionyl-tRNA formyltransferase
VERRSAIDQEEKHPMTPPESSQAGQPAALRIVSFNNIPPLFELVRSWAERAGHRLVLVVTTPGPKTRRSDGYRQIVAAAGEHNIEALITTRLKTVATPILRALTPDLIVSASFPWRLPPELRQTARLGAVNLHPAVLPAYRGPNVLRQFYEAAPQIGATLHWTDDDFDTGRVLSQHVASLPQPCTREALAAAWFPTLAAALAEGVARAIAGEPGAPQSEEGASYAAAFSEAEHWLDMSEPAFRLQCKVTALNLMGGAVARAHIAGQDWQIEQLDLVDGSPVAAPPGALIERLADGLVVQAGDAAVRLRATPQPERATG